MSNDDDDEEFNQCNVIVMVKKVPKMSPSFTCMNELHNLVHKNEWENVVERMKQKQQVRIMNNNNDESQSMNLPLEIECVTSDGDMPLFTCLRNMHVPFKVVKMMIGKCIQITINNNKCVNNFKLDNYPSSLCCTNKKLRNANASHLVSEGSENLSDDRIKIIHFIVDMNYESLEHTNPQDGMNALHHAINLNPVS